MINRAQIHKDHRPCHLYDNGCMMCNDVESLHTLIVYFLSNRVDEDNTVIPNRIRFTEDCIVELISSIKKLHKEQEFIND